MDLGDSHLHGEATGLLAVPGAWAVLAPPRAGELLAGRAQELVQQERLSLHLSEWGKQKK